MKTTTGAFGFAPLALAACSSINGLYAPACPSFAGQTITLDGGRFVLDKFTDTVDVDDNGNPIDPFPGYPMQGDYRREGSVVYLRSDSGTDLPTLYLAQVGNKKWLLTKAEYEEWTREGSVGPCALARGGRKAD